MKRKLIMLKLLILNNGFKKAEYIRNKKNFNNMGKNCYYHPYIIPTESHLVTFHNNVVICKGVELITHDMTWTLFKNCSNIEKSGYFPYYKGNIEMFDNVMVGANSIILPNVKIGPNVIIGAGSVVTKDIPKNVIVAGNPAKIVGNFFDLADKRKIMERELS